MGSPPHVGVDPFEPGLYCVTWKESFADPNFRKIRPLFHTELSFFLDPYNWHIVVVPVDIHLELVVMVAEAVHVGTAGGGWCGRVWEVVQVEQVVEVVEAGKVVEVVKVVEGGGAPQVDPSLA